MRLSVPTIPAVISTALSTKTISKRAAAERIAAFLAPGNVATITGAGVSVDSGIRAYRGAKGIYLNPNYKPIFYHELVDPTSKGFAFRQRYWLRSYLGYAPVRNALPNTTHHALAALQYTNVVKKLITQNVDGLHHKALSEVWNPTTMQERILELHGSLHKVHCTHGHVVDRDVFQDWLSAANPQWKTYMDHLEATGQRPRTNPDGDVVLEEGARYDTFQVPECPSCLPEHRPTSVMKPELIFFGESILPEVRERSYKYIEDCSRLFMIGTTLATYSAFRLVKHAVELNKPVLLLNVGPTRADPLPGVEKIELLSRDVMREAVRGVLGSRVQESSAVERMLESGIMKPPPEYE